MKAKVLTAILALTVLFSIARDSYGWGQNPEANLEVFREYTIVGRPVILDGNDPCNPSIDPDGYITKYEWDFDYPPFICDYYETSSRYPDGAFDGKTTYTYDSNGTYQVMLKVTDDDELSDYLDDPCTVYICLDEDGDNLPDDWEDLYDLNDANFADADIDSDDDNYNNLCEYLHGSEPNDANSVPLSSFNITIYVPDDVSCIQRAINASIDGDTIVVSEGTYYEAIDFNDVNCILISTDPNDWNVVAATIIDANDPNAEVVTFENSEDANSVLRGFTITGGDVGIYCDGASPAISNCVIKDNDSSSYGGGIYDCNSAPTVTNCIFSENDADCGGGIYDVNSSPTLISCVFVGNTADTDGGAMYNYDSSPIIINCTFSENSAAGDGGGMYSYGSSDPNVTNSIFWGNSATGTGDEIYNDGSADPNFSYCDIKGCGGSSVWDSNFGSDDGGNIDSEPNFVDANDPDGPDGIFATFDDGLHLQYLQLVSPCIDAADGNAAPSTDITGIVRSDVNTIVNTGTGTPDYADIGAYESPMIWFVDEDVNDSNDGTSWADAFDDLQDALADACGGDEIWVAEGTYEPNGGSDRTVSFELVEGAALYGGFADTEVSRHQRDWILYKTTLSGDIGTVGDQNDNSYHVVTGADNAILDGFTITGGYADIAASNYIGGGIYCSSVSPTIRNCTIKDNYAHNSGGGMYNTSSFPTLYNCVFIDNSAKYNGNGGGMYNVNSCPTLANCVFTANTAYVSRGFCYGGGMYNSNSSPVLTGCTFAKNMAKNYGGAIYNTATSLPTLSNCVLWGNSALSGTGDEIYNDSSSAMISYCDIEGCGGSGGGWDPNFGNDFGGNIDSDPCFADVNNPAGNDDVFGTWDDGLRIDANDILCIDSADGDAAPLQDMLGLDRIDMDAADNNGVGDPNYVDMGAYESYYDIDSDGDGIPDDYEILNDLNPNDSNDKYKDFDGDGLSNYDEFIIGTWANSSDTDDDGMDDWWEHKYGLDPLEYSANNDADGDGINDLTEYQEGSNPTIYNTVTVVVYQYNNAGDVITETIQDGNDNDVAITEYDYDELGRKWRQRRRASLSSQDDVNDIITLYSYDTRSSIKKTAQKAEINDPNVNIIEPNDLVTENTYNSLGRLTDVNNPLGGITSYTYYVGGEPNQVTDPNGNTTTNYYDNAGRLEKVEDDEDHYREYYYDSLGRTIKQIACDKNNNNLMQTRFEYNGVGNVTSRAMMADADSVADVNTSIDMVVDYNYADSNGLLVDETKWYNSGTKAITHYCYDDLGRRDRIVDPCDNETLLTYNEVGQVTRRQQIDDDPIGSNDLTITTDYHYDSLGRLRHQVALLYVNDANTWQWTTYYYDDLGNRMNEYRPSGMLILSTYNALSQLTEKVADCNYPEGSGSYIEQTTQYAYDRLGRQTSITGYADPNIAQTTTYYYDKLSRITNIIYPDGNDITYEYNPVGRVSKRTDQRLIVTTYTYDGTYNMLGKYVDGNGVTDDANEIFTYDGLGRMLTATKDVNGTQIALTEFVYNDIGRITDTNETLPGMGTKTISYIYDQAGYRKYTIYPWTTTLYTSVTRDWQGRIDTLKVKTWTRVKYKYIGSRVAQRTYCPYFGTTTRLITYDISYDNLGRTTRGRTIEEYGTTDIVAAFDYQYDPNTNSITKMTYDHRTGDPCVDFTYDDLDRLNRAEYGIDDTNEIFTIDDLGNRDSVNVRDTNDVDYDIDSLTNRYDKVGDANLTYNAAGDLTKDKDAYEYEYDYENRITKITKDGNDIAEFAYDALGRRIKKVDAIADTTNIYYYNDNWQVLCDYNDSNVLQNWFAYGNYIDEVLIMGVDSTFYNTFKYYVHDHLYSPVALIDYGCQALERYEYDAYGNCHILEPNLAPDPNGKSDYENPYLFTGRRVDILDNGSLTIQYNRNRYYDQYTARWLTHDPQAFHVRVEFGQNGPLFVGTEVGRDTSVTDPHDKPGTVIMVSISAGSIHYADGMNLYDYAHDNPLQNTDQFGLWDYNVHLNATRRWAETVGYKKGICAEVLGKRCNEVDSGSTSPRPWGDFSYHFEPGREARHIEWLNKARAILRPPTISYPAVIRGLFALGRSLHPLQDSFSHIESHEAATPWDHAPKEWCRRIWRPILGEPYPGYCKEQSRKDARGERVHKNWDDPYLPDKIVKWPEDYRRTKGATEEVLKEFIRYPCVCARCKLGLVW